eukprot:5740264-Prymnesium_polylepis.1
MRWRPSWTAMPATVMHGTTSVPREHSECMNVECSRSENTRDSLTIHSRFTRESLANHLQITPNSLTNQRSFSSKFTF